MSVRSNVIYFGLLIANFAFYIIISDFLNSDYFNKMGIKCNPLTCWRVIV